MKVGGVSYSRHDKRGGRPSLKVSYSCGLTTYREWVCFEHQGYARRKAEEWWRKRAPGIPVPRSVNEALAQSRQVLIERTRVIGGVSFPPASSRSR